MEYTKKFATTGKPASTRQNDAVAETVVEKKNLGIPVTREALSAQLTAHIGKIMPTKTTGARKRRREPTP
ncbi:MAG: hypothetical protein WC521_00465 [Bdellovibrionales bacterium]